MCRVCESRLEHPGIKLCHVCGHEAFSLLSHSDCLNFSHLDGVVYGCKYSAQSRRFIMGLKYKSEFLVAQRMADVMVRQLKFSGMVGGSAWLGQPLPAIQITFVPVSRQRLHLRGYNQAQLLAQAIAVRIGAEVHDLLIKQDDIRSQVGFTREDRLANMQGVFQLQNLELVDPLKPIFLVDDVLTTGATLEACARELRSGGLTRIYGLTFARKL